MLESRIGRTMSSELPDHCGERVMVTGWCHKVRDLGGLAFVVLRDATGLCQVVADGAAIKPSPEDAIMVVGTVRAEPRAPGGCEIHAEDLAIIAPAVDTPPLYLGGKALDSGLDAILANRHISLRHPSVSSVFRLQAALVRGFRSFLEEQGFLEVFTPKIVAQGTEGGAELFGVDYFGTRAYLAQSPQFYKQTLVAAGFERVYEVGHAYRAEEHSTSRHLNEYVSLDVEMGFIESAEELMALEEALLRRMFLEAGVRWSGVSIPRIPLSECRDTLLKEYSHRSPEGNLDPEGERLLCEWVERETGSPFVFVTEYPRSKRPMYAKPLPGKPGLTESFDLLHKGLEVTTGGMRLHDPRELEESIRDKGLDPAAFEGYVSAFRFGAPPHGGFAIGLERLTMRILGLKNVREASMFPRDRERLTP